MSLKVTSPAARTLRSIMQWQCIKWQAWSLALLLPLLARASDASHRPRDPWLALAGPLERNPGAAGIVEAGPAAEGWSAWCARSQLFGLAELGSLALAAAADGGLGRWNLGYHRLDAGFWCESQVAIRWGPPRGENPDGLDWALGLEERRNSSAWHKVRRCWMMADLAWRQAPLSVQARVQAPGAIVTGGGEGAGMESLLRLGWRINSTWGLTLRTERSQGRHREEAALVWQGHAQGLAAGWKAGRGWEVAARARWRGFSLSMSWWVHPVLPPTSTWSMEWRGAGRP